MPFETPKQKSDMIQFTYFWKLLCVDNGWRRARVEAGSSMEAHWPSFKWLEISLVKFESILDAVASLVIDCTMGNEENSAQK